MFNEVCRVDIVRIIHLSRYMTIDVSFHDVRDDAGNYYGDEGDYYEDEGDYYGDYVDDDYDNSKCGSG